MSDYPTEEDIKKIEEWDCVNDPEGLLEFIRPLWEGYGCIEIKGKRVKRVYMATGGWSGNEDIISAMHKNFFFAFWWQQPKSGGSIRDYMTPECIDSSGKYIASATYLHFSLEWQIVKFPEFFEIIKCECSCCKCKGCSCF